VHITGRLIIFNNFSKVTATRVSFFLSLCSVLKKQGGMDRWAFCYYMYGLSERRGLLGIKNGENAT
jgi:hypothetical protein